jgi:asparagine synthase (glutamine-hydrolysing)
VADPWRWQQRAGPRWWTYLADALTEQRERAGAHDYLRRRNAMAGVVGGHPFLQDLDLIELMLRLPPELAFDERFDRPLLRSAVQGVVPDSIRLRAEKSYFTPLFVEAVDRHDRQRIMELLTSKDAASRAYTQPDVVRRLLLETPPERRGGQWAWALWRLVMLECWLRREEAAVGG